MMIELSSLKEREINENRGTKGSRGAASSAKGSPRREWSHWESGCSMSCDGETDKIRTTTDEGGAGWSPADGFVRHTRRGDVVDAATVWRQRRG